MEAQAHRDDPQRQRLRLAPGRCGGLRARRAPSRSRVAVRARPPAPVAAPCATRTGRRPATGPAIRGRSRAAYGPISRPRAPLPQTLGAGRRAGAAQPAPHARGWRDKNVARHGRAGRVRGGPVRRLVRPRRRRPRRGVRAPPTHLVCPGVVLAPLAAVLGAVLRFGLDFSATRTSSFACALCAIAAGCRGRSTCRPTTGSWRGTHSHIHIVRGRPNAVRVSLPQLRRCRRRHALDLTPRLRDRRPD